MLDKSSTCNRKYCVKQTNTGKILGKTNTGRILGKTNIGYTPDALSHSVSLLHATYRRWLIVVGWLEVGGVCCFQVVLVVLWVVVRKY